MSTQSTAARGQRALTAVALSAALTAPAAAGAQSLSSERTLLNRIAVPVRPEIGFTWSAAYPARPAALIDGAAALLGRPAGYIASPAAPGPIAAPAPDGRLEGERALLGLVARAKARREGER